MIIDIIKKMHGWQGDPQYKYHLLVDECEVLKTEHLEDISLAITDIINNAIKKG